MNSSTGHENPNEWTGLEAPLEGAVRALLAEPVPRDAVRRVIDRAAGLTVPSTEVEEAAQPASRERPALGRKRWLRWGAAAAVAGAVLAALSLFPFSTNVSRALAEVADAVGKQPWMHGTTTVTVNDKTVQTMEFWLLRQYGVLATKRGDEIRFTDLAQHVSLAYDPKEQVILRGDSKGFELNEERIGIGSTAQFFERLTSKPDASGTLFDGERVVKTERRDVSSDGDKRIEYLVELQRVGTGSSRTVRMRVVAATQLPETAEEIHSNGGRIVTRFDYPEEGPRSIYAMGGLKTKRIVDRVPADLRRIIAAYRAARSRFEDYDAIVIQFREGSASPEELEGRDVYRVRRKGDRWRFDKLVMWLPTKPGPVAPEPGADLRKWWKENRDKYRSVPMVIGDGRTESFYRPVHDVGSNDKNPDLAVALQTQFPAGRVSSPSEVMPHWRHLAPEYVSRPTMGEPTRSQTIEFDPESTDGPDGTVRVIITNVSEDPLGEMYRFWFDPAHDHVLRKEICHVRQRSGDLIYTETKEFSDLAMSPNGFWFPQRIRRWTGDSRLAEAIDFYVDFDAQLDDELFRPLP